MVNRRHHPRGPDHAQDRSRQLSKATEIPVRGLRERRPRTRSSARRAGLWFNRADGKKAATVIEGFLFPDTYEFPPNADRRGILKMMVNQFLTVDRRHRVRRHVQSNAADHAVRGADRGVARPGRGAATTRTRQGRPGGSTTGSTAAVPVQLPAVRQRRSTTGCGSRQADQGLRATLTTELHDPNNPYNTHDKSRACRSGRSATPARRRCRAAMNPPTARTGCYFVAIDKQPAHTKFSRRRRRVHELTARPAGTACAD